MGRELVKSEHGVSIYKEDNMLVMYIEERKVMELDQKFKDMLDKSYDNLVSIRKQNSEKSE